MRPAYQSILVLLACFAAACAVAPPSEGDFVLPALGVGGKTDSTVMEVFLTDGEHTGNGWETSVAFSSDGDEPFVAVAVLDGGQSSRTETRFWVDTDVGVPHLFVRDVDDGSVAVEIHGAEDGVLVVPADSGAPRYQLVLFITEAGQAQGVIHLQQFFSCTRDDELAGNDSYESASPLGDRPHSGVVCNRSDEADLDFVSLEDAVAGQVARVTMFHVPAFGELEVSFVDGASKEREALAFEDRDGETLARSEAVVRVHTDARLVEADGPVVYEVRGHELWNTYRISLCLDDALDVGANGIGNETPETAVALETGVTERGLVVCPGLLGQGIELQPDVDFYSVEIPANRVSRIRTEGADASGLYLDGPADAIEVEWGVWDLAPAPTARRVVFGLYHGHMSRPMRYDLTVDLL